MFGTPDRPRSVDGHSLWPGPRRWLALGALVPRDPALLLFCPKAVPIEWWYGGELERSMGFLHVPFPGDPRLSGAVRAFGAGDAPLLFVGDLDSVAIAQYLAARSMLAAARGPLLRYAGINDAWLSAIAKPHRPLARLSIRMTGPERRLLRALEAAVDLDHLVGPESAQMLRDGDKVELEAGLNPGFHGAAHRQWIIAYLRAQAAAQANGQGATPERGRRTKR